MTVAESCLDSCRLTGLAGQQVSLRPLLRYLDPVNIIRIFGGVCGFSFLWLRVC
jgi:hypothetical protein